MSRLLANNNEYFLWLFHTCTEFKVYTEFIEVKYDRFNTTERSELISTLINNKKERIIKYTYEKYIITK